MHTQHTCACVTHLKLLSSSTSVPTFYFLESWPICPQVCVLCWAVLKDAVFSMWDLLSDTTSTASWIHTGSSRPREVHFHHNSFTLINIIRELLALSFLCCSQSQSSTPFTCPSWSLQNHTVTFSARVALQSPLFVYPGQSSLTDCWDSKAYNPDNRMVMTEGETTAEETKQADWQPLRG